MTVFIPIIVVMSITLWGAVKFNKNFVEMLPVVIGLIITVLYLFYCIDMLLAGFYIIITFFFGAVISIIFWLKTKNRRNSLAKVLFRPCVLIWLLSLILIYIITKDNIVSLWDELRLWGAYPKILFYTGKFQLSSDSLMFTGMRSYIPGISLWAYFFEKCSFNFRESTLFFSYGVYASSLLAAGFSELKWKEYYKIPIAVIIIFLIPALCYNSSFDFANFYASLFVDPIIGLTLGYLLYLMTRGGVFTELFSFFRLAAALITLVLLKSSGIVLTVIVILGAMIYEKRKNGQWLIKGGMLLLSNVFVWGIWQILCFRENVKNIVGFHSSLLRDGTALKSFVKEIFLTNVIQTDYPDLINTCSFIMVYFILTVILFIVGAMSGREKRRRYFVSYMTLNVCTFFFMAGLYLIYGGKESTSSFPRYTCTMLCAMVVFIFFMFSENFKAIWEGRRLNRLLTQLIFISVFAVFPFHSAKGLDNVCKPAVETGIESSLALNEKMKLIGLKENVNIYVICEGWDLGLYSLCHHRIYFESLGKKYHVKNYYDITNVSTDSDIPQDIQDARNQFRNFLNEEQCSYVWIQGISERFAEQFGDMFSEDVKENSLWKVNGDGEDVLLRLAE